MTPRTARALVLLGRVCVLTGVAILLFVLGWTIGDSR